MAQGAVKKSKPASAPRRPNNPGAKKGLGVVKPKRSSKQSLAQQVKKDKKLSARLTAGTERMLAERAGHLEMLKGGKKERRAKAEAKAQAKAKGVKSK